MNVGAPSCTPVHISRTIVTYRPLTWPPRRGLEKNRAALHLDPPRPLKNSVNYRRVSRSIAIYRGSLQSSARCRLEWRNPPKPPLFHISSPIVSYRTSPIVAYRHVSQSHVSARSKCIVAYRHLSPPTSLPIDGRWGEGSTSLSPPPRVRPVTSGGEARRRHRAGGWGGGCFG